MQRIFYPRDVYITAAAAVGGKEEYRGPLGRLFDHHDESDRFGEKTWEKAESEMGRLSLQFALNKGGVHPSDVDAVFAGDLQNQCVASSRALLSFGIPYVGLYGACSTCTEGLVLASLLLGGGCFSRCAVLSSSHNCAAERQFRLPLEYGGQRTPTAQWTATAAGGFLLHRASGEPKTDPSNIPDWKSDTAFPGDFANRISVKACLIGCAVDGGVRDAANMGAAMAPAAADSIFTFLQDTGTSFTDYDAVITGDLGWEGSNLLERLLHKNGIEVGQKHLDCGCLLYDAAKQDVHAGGSGCGCSAAVLAAYVLPRLACGIWKKVLFLSTGALMSPSSIEQGENIYGIAPAILLTNTVQ